MQAYEIFLSQGAGIYGGARTVWLEDDPAAIAIGHRLLLDAVGVDIWSSGKRLVLMTRGGAQESARV